MKDDLKWAQQLINELFLFSSEPDFSEYALEDLFKLLLIADDQYSNTSKPVMTDEQYDALYLFCKTSDPSNSYFYGVGSEVRGGKIKLPYTMGSLTQAYVGDTQKWIAQFKLSDETITITEKLDGISTLIIYDSTGKLQIAYSRGDGTEGADITRHVSKITSVPKNVGRSLAVRAEIIFKKSDWEIVKTKIKRSGGAFYKNARNATAGLMNASESDPTAYQYLSVVAYEILNEQDNKNTQLDKLEDVGFETPRAVSRDGSVCTDDILTALLNKWRDETDYEIDGIVLDVNKLDLRKKINPSRSTLNPEYARKFKVADASNNAIATVIEVQWNVSKNGYLKPRVKIEPVELVGVTVQHATGFNAKFIYENKIGPGAKIRITRSGDVIPFLLGVVEPMPEENM